MEIGCVTNVYPSRKTIDIRLVGSGGGGIQPDVPLTKRCGLPQVGDKVLLGVINSEYVGIDVLNDESAATIESNEAERLQAGDEVIGKFGEAVVGKLEGGIVVCLANPATGLMASSQNGSAVLMGDMLSLEHTNYHWSARNTDLGDAEISSSLFTPTSQVMDYRTETFWRKITNKISNWEEINIIVNEMVTDLVPRLFRKLNLSITTAQGELFLLWDLGSLSIGIPGPMQAIIAGTVSVTVPSIGINSSGLPQDGVVTGTFWCPYAKAPLWTFGNVSQSLKVGT